ncbi:DUF4326 domain-containing protein [Natrarchaeobius halalkaliphilus]|uniref:DUF4326 domain-containing protein n=1 Tax=Natrarchaeobius halalkaliphilus TaxID=1679091 RepID=A0A3N6MC75_9EURY|nr:DUF4326 domain-containing protein [Natrarchaeobius halalkaliphilus]RQG93091.1 DUF4326 domain-containing protein [Natrarchaeobius halalkaliphilus]
MTTERVHKSEPHDVYIGRGQNGETNMGGVPIGVTGWLGNPYKESHYGREKCIELFERDLGWMVEGNPVFRAKLVSLYGKTLGCYCFDHQECHGDVIVSKINELYLESL